MVHAGQCAEARLQGFTIHCGRQGGISFTTHLAELVQDSLWLAVKLTDHALKDAFRHTFREVFGTGEAGKAIDADEAKTVG